MRRTFSTIRIHFRRDDDNDVNCTHHEITNHKTGYCSVRGNAIFAIFFILFYYFFVPTFSYFSFFLLFVFFLFFVFGGQKSQSDRLLLRSLSNTLWPYPCPPLVLGQIQKLVHFQFSNVLRTYELSSLHFVCNWAGFYCFIVCDVLLDILYLAMAISVEKKIFLCPNESWK